MGTAGWLDAQCFRSLTSELVTSGRSPKGFLDPCVLETCVWRVVALCRCCLIWPYSNGGSPLVSETLPAPHWGNSLLTSSKLTSTSMRYAACCNTHTHTHLCLSFLWALLQVPCVLASPSWDGAEAGGVFGVEAGLVKKLHILNLTHYQYLPWRFRFGWSWSTELKMLNLGSRVYNNDGSLLVHGSRVSFQWADNVRKCEGDVDPPWLSRAGNLSGFACFSDHRCTILRRSGGPSRSLQRTAAPRRRGKSTTTAMTTTTTTTLSKTEKSGWTAMR